LWILTSLCIFTRLAVSLVGGGVNGKIGIFSPIRSTVLPITTLFVPMRFCLLDKIVELVPGQRVVAVKHLHAEEDYLKDHFPKFPVMPGVLMLEAMYQAGAWLVRETDQFQNPAVILREARNVKYSDFVAPGQTLTVTAEWQKRDGRLISLRAQGTVGNSVAVSARLVLEQLDLSKIVPLRRTADATMRDEYLQVYARIKP
jgi:3-hydroxyacyl-[acyl-carrier-protein] dehydratase